MSLLIKQRTYDEIRQSIRNNINDKDEKIDSKPGTFVSDVFVCPEADELASFYIDMKLMEINQSVLTASGHNLDRLGYNYFTYRKGAGTATGRVRFYIKNTNRTTLTLSALPKEVYIPVGFQVATSGTTTDTQMVFSTTESAYATNREIYDTLPTDNSTGYKYLECDVTCTTSGSSGNVAAGTIIQLYSGSLDGVVSITNTIACSGGENAESDTSLKMRIMLAILGASICTKNGYLKFIIQKDFVEDAIVIGGGDTIMFRDGGFINAAKEYQYGRGGMVDIWVRGKQLQEIDKSFKITTSYLKNGAADIIFENQPVVNIVSITSQASGVTYENADKYEIEYGTTANKITQTYYKDIFWDFSITETFNDTDYYPIDIIDSTEIEVLKKKVDLELQEAKEYLYNIDYSINWSLVTYEDLSKYKVAPMFQKVYYNGKPYKIIAVDKRLNGRTFIKKKNRIYLRVYTKPDYALVPSTYSDEKYSSKLGKDIGGSIISKDCVHWINKNILQEGDTLVIKYNFNQLILALQSEMNAKRILTADILIRQAIEVPLQIIMNVYCDGDYDSLTIQNTIATTISTFVNNLKSMGSTIEDSELVALARNVTGVLQVDLDSVSLSKKNKLSTSKIELENNEYFTLDTLEVNVISENTIES